MRVGSERKSESEKSGLREREREGGVRMGRERSVERSGSVRVESENGERGER